MKRDEIIYRIPLQDYAESLGWQLERNGNEYVTLCPFHDDHHPSLRLNPDKHVWFCDPCHIGGSVIDLEMRLNGLSSKDAMNRLAESVGEVVHTIKGEKPVFRTVARYKYVDEQGRPVFGVDRREDGTGRKKFRQYHLENGDEVNGMDGVSRVLYRLPSVMVADTVYVVEGEQCVHACEAMGLVATTNPGGKNGWLDGYADWLADKHIRILPDNKDGEEWTDHVLKSVRGKVLDVQVCRMQERYDDVGDMVDDLGATVAKAELDAMLGHSPMLNRGLDVPLLSARQVMDRYVRQVRSSERGILDLRKWLPGFAARDGRRVRPLCRGEMVTISARTGHGKSGAAQNITMSHPHLTTIFFTPELPLEDLAERYTAMSYKMAASVVEQQVKDGDNFGTDKWDHVYPCGESDLSCDRIREIVSRSELVTGKRADLVIVDYIQLLQDKGKSKYEQISSSADGLKRLARKLNVVMVMVSQVGRPPTDQDGTPKTVEVGLHDSKDSGNIENSGQVALGLWRLDDDTMIVQVNKATKGGAGIRIECNFNGKSMLIQERAKQHSTEEDGL